MLAGYIARTNRLLYYPIAFSRVEPLSLSARLSPQLSDNVAMEQNLGEQQTLQTVLVCQVQRRRQQRALLSSLLQQLHPPDRTKAFSAAADWHISSRTLLPLPLPPPSFLPCERVLSKHQQFVLWCVSVYNRFPLYPILSLSAHHQLRLCFSGCVCVCFTAPISLRTSLLFSSPERDRRSSLP